MIDCFALGPVILFACREWQVRAASVCHGNLGLVVGDAGKGAGTDGEWSLPWSVQRGEGPLFGPSWIGCQGVQGGSASAHLRVGMKGVGDTSLSRAESTVWVWESWTSPKVAVGGQGPGARPWRTRSSNAEPKGEMLSE